MIFLVLFKTFTQNTLELLKTTASVIERISYLIIYKSLIQEIDLQFTGGFIKQSCSSCWLTNIKNSAIFELYFVLTS